MYGTGHPVTQPYLHNQLVTKLKMFLKVLLLLLRCLRNFPCNTLKYTSNSNMSHTTLSKNNLMIDDLDINKYYWYRFPLFIFKNHKL